MSSSQRSIKSFFSSTSSKANTKAGGDTDAKRKMEEPEPEKEANSEEEEEEEEEENVSPKRSRIEEKRAMTPEQKVD